ncbi:MAG: DUF2793 domain-containing protein [Sulfitobacter sp.]
MPQTSPRLDLPYLQPSQAQKHVTHNEALQRLDVLTQLVVSQFDATDPPALPELGEVFALGSSPTGVWAGQSQMLAAYTESGWLFLAPQEGWRTWGVAEDELRTFDGTDWIPSDFSLQNVDGVGIGTTSDATNRLAVNAAATLLNHEGSGGHQVKVNKATETDTASLLFQSNFTGHAEMGLAGNNAFTVKVSADGTNWQQVMAADPQTQTITFAPAGSDRVEIRDDALAVDVPITGTAVQTTPADVTPGRLMKAENGILKTGILGTVSQTAGVPTGSIIERGSNANGHYIRFADGTQICTVHDFELTFLNSATIRNDWVFPAAFIDSTRTVTYTMTRSPANVAPPTSYRSGFQFEDTQVESPTQARIAWLGSGWSDQGSLYCRIMAIGRWF